MAIGKNTMQTHIHITFGHWRQCCLSSHIHYFWWEVAQAKIYIHCFCRHNHEAQYNPNVVFQFLVLGRGAKEELTMEHSQRGAFKHLVLEEGREELPMQDYQRGEEVAMVLLHWVAKQLLPTFNPPWLEVTSTTYDDFAALALCNQELHKINR